MKRINFKRFLAGIAVFPATFLVGCGCVLLLPSWNSPLAIALVEADRSYLSQIEIDKIRWQKEPCDMDIFADPSPNWPRNGPKKTVKLGVLDQQRLCRRYAEGNGIAVEEVDVSRGRPGRARVAVKIDENGYIRSASILEGSDRYSNEFLRFHALNVRIRPVKLGGDPTACDGIITEKYFDAVNLPEK